jgi:hypothetical protein
MARSNPPSKEFPIKTDAKPARAINTWIFTFPPTISVRASSDAETWKQKWHAIVTYYYSVKIIL